MNENTAKDRMMMSLSLSIPDDGNYTHPRLNALRQAFLDADKDMAPLIDEVDGSHFFYKWQGQSFKSHRMCHELVMAFEEFCEVPGYEFGRTSRATSYLKADGSVGKTHKNATGLMLERAKDAQFNMSCNDNWVDNTAHILAAGCFVGYMTRLLQRWLVFGERLNTSEQFAVLEMYNIR